MKVRVLISAVLLALGLVMANMPSHRAMADLGPCTNCGAVVSSDGS